MSDEKQQQWNGKTIWDRLQEVREHFKNAFNAYADEQTKSGHTSELEALKLLKELPLNFKVFQGIMHFEPFTDENRMNFFQLMATMRNRQTNGLLTGLLTYKSLYFSTVEELEEIEVSLNITDQLNEAVLSKKNIVQVFFDQFEEANMSFDDFIAPSPITPE